MRKLPRAMRSFGMAALIGALVACAHAPETRTPPGLSAIGGPPPGAPSARHQAVAAPLQLPSEKPERKHEPVHIYPGSGVFAKPPSKATTPPEGSGEVTLNFENADLREVVKVVLGDMLNQNYVLDPRVKGAVTVQTSRPLTREDLLPTLDTLLRMNGAALVRSATGYQVLPLAGALQGTLTPQLERSMTTLRPGYGVLVVPLKYIGVAEMQKLLDPFAPPGSVVRADEARNLLILAGTRQELNHLIETIKVFDVDYLAGMSVGLFPLKSVEAKTVAEEIQHLLGGKAAGPLAGMFRILPIERLNALLVVTQQPKYLEDARTWIERLDRESNAAGRQLYVYQVQNGSAEHLAEVLGELFGVAKPTQAGPRPPQVAPGLTGAQIGSPGLTGTQLGSLGLTGAQTGSLGLTGTQTGFLAEGAADPGTAPETAYQVGATGTLGGGGMLGGGAAASGKLARRQGFQAGAPGAARGGGATAAKAEGISIIADTETNSLLILATATEYEKIEAAIRKLDIVPRQVLIEATIAEVQLIGDLQYGLEWWFNGQVGAYKGTGSLGLTTQETLTSMGVLGGNGLSYAITDAGGIVRALLKTLADDNLVNVISSPQLMVTDNQTAQIQVGDQVPVQTGTTVVSGGATTSSFQYVQTGVVLQVTPRVNAGGLVTMELSQQVTRQVPTPASNTTSTAQVNPTISQRAIQSVVVVQSGQTLVLGGLIQNTDQRGKSGIPGLYKMPIIGPLFGSTNDHKERDELVVLITPRVVRDQREAQDVTEEIRRKLEEVVPYSAQQPWRTPGPVGTYRGAS